MSAPSQDATSTQEKLRKLLNASRLPTHEIPNVAFEALALYRTFIQDHRGEMGLGGPHHDEFAEFTQTLIVKAFGNSARSWVAVLKDSGSSDRYGSPESPYGYGAHQGYGGAVGLSDGGEALVNLFSAEGPFWEVSHSWRRAPRSGSSANLLALVGKDTGGGGKGGGQAAGPELPLPLEYFPQHSQMLLKTRMRKDAQDAAFSQNTLELYGGISALGGGCFSLGAGSVGLKIECVEEGGEDGKTISCMRTDTFEFYLTNLVMFATDTRAVVTRFDGTLGSAVTDGYASYSHRRPIHFQPGGRDFAGPWSAFVPRSRLAQLDAAFNQTGLGAGEDAPAVLPGKLDILAGSSPFLSLLLNHAGALWPHHRSGGGGGDGGGGFAQLCGSKAELERARAGELLVRLVCDHWLAPWCTAPGSGGAAGRARHRRLQDDRDAAMLAHASGGGLEPATPRGAVASLGPPREVNLAMVQGLIVLSAHVLADPSLPSLSCVCEPQELLDRRADPEVSNRHCLSWQCPALQLST